MKLRKPAASDVVLGLLCMMNTGSAIAAVLSPWAFGYLADLTGNWHVPFIGSLGLLVLGAALSFWMRVEVPFEEQAAAVS